jgi:dihydroxy-acid dehydratase
MEDFDHAGGVPALLSVLADRLSLDRPTVAGGTMLSHVQLVAPGTTTIRTPDNPVHAGPGLRMVWGSLAPGGALVKVAAASADLLRHRGPAVVFDGVDDMKARIDDPDLPVTADSVLVLRGVGPIGGPGMPEAGFVPIPAKLARQGVTDILRITDARMSGTAFGTIVLHVSPEAALQGPLARVRDGDIIAFDAERGRLDVEVDPQEFADRADSQDITIPHRGWDRLYSTSVLGADRGVDLDFLVGGSGPAPARATREGKHGVKP